MSWLHRLSAVVAALLLPYLLVALLRPEDVA